jgi:putative PEP-CTERM system TPR-repeat lipoprotein
LKKLYVSLAVLALMGCSEKTSKEYLTSAKTMIGQENNSGAVIDLKKAIKQEPKLLEARFLLGKINLENNQYSLAEKELERAIDGGYSKKDVYPYLVRAYIRNNSFDMLTKINVDEIGLTGEDKYEAIFYKLNALLSLGNNKEYGVAYQALPIESDFNFITLSHVLNTFQSAGLTKTELPDSELSAISIKLEKVLSKDKGNAFALKYKGMINLKDNPEKTAEVYKEYVELYPSDMEMKFKYLQLMVDLDKAIEVESIVDNLLTVNDRHAALNRFKSIARYSEKDYLGALKYAEKGIIENSTDVSLRLLAGQSAYMLKEYYNASRHIIMISNMIPPNHNALRVLALSQLNDGQIVEASKTLMDMEGLTEKDSLLFTNISLALINSGEKLRAKKLMKKSEGISETSESLAGRGVVEISLNDINGINSLKAAIKKEPESKSAKVALASAYLKIGDFKSLKVHVDSWIKVDPSEISALYFLSQVQLNKGDNEAARLTFNKILSFDKDNKEARMSLIDIAYKRGDVKEANELLSALLKKDKNYTPAIAKSYLYGKDQGKSQDVIDLIKVRIEEDSTNVDLSLLLAGILMSEKNTKEAAVVLDSISSFNNLSSRYFMLLAEVHAKNNNVEKLIASNEQWLKAYPGNKEAITSSLMALSSQNKYKEALRISQDYLDIQGKNAYIQLLHSHFLVMTGDLSGAKISFAKLPIEISRLPFAKGIKAKIQISEKDYKGALVNLKVAYDAEKNHENIKLIFKLSNALKQGDKGYDLLVNHVKEVPNDVLSLMMLADIQIRKDVSLSIINYEKALKINGNNFIALNNLANLHLDKKNYDRAQELAEKAVALKGDIPNIIDTLAMIHLAKKDYTASLNELQKAVEINGVSHSIYLNYIKLLFLNDKSAAAERAIMQYKDKYSNEKMRKDLDDLLSKHS